MEDSQAKHFIVNFTGDDPDEILRLRARKIEESDLGLGFITVSDFIFDESDTVLSSEDLLLRKRFENTKCLHLSLQAIISVEEIKPEKEISKKLSSVTRPVLRFPEAPAD